jgi:hypothetical protein
MFQKRVVRQSIVRYAVALLCVAVLAGCKADADFSDNLRVDQLPAEDYRGEIASIDRFLFRTTPLAGNDARDLEQIIDGLATRVANADKSSRFLKLESLELQLLAKRAGRLSGATGSQLQDNWMRIRNNVFDDRAWFVRSANDLDYAAKEVPDVSAALNGRWRLTSILANGAPRDDAELTDSIWTFDLPRLTIQDRSGKTKTYTCAVEENYLALDEGSIRFEANEDGLRLAFFDGLKGKPKSFEPSPGPLLVVVQLRRE